MSTKRKRSTNPSSDSHATPSKKRRASRGRENDTPSAKSDHRDSASLDDGTDQEETAVPRSTADRESIDQARDEHATHISNGETTWSVNSQAASTRDPATAVLGQYFDDISERRTDDTTALRMSARTLLDPRDDSDDEEALLAQKILREEQRDGGGSDAEDSGAEGSTIRMEPAQGDAETPSRKRKARPKSTKLQRTPSPPRNLPPYEQYFFQNRAASKTSDSTLPTSALLTHEDYFSAIHRYRDPHKDEVDFLENLHRRAFHQWAFELDNGFSVCLHGWGSKHALLRSFAEYLHETSETAPAIIMIQGYEASLTIRQILSSIAGVIPSLAGRKLGAQPSDVLSSILTAVKSTSTKGSITLVVSSIDAAPLRKPAVQAILARLASSPYFHVVACVDNPNFGLLWDSSIRAQFNWVYHDATTFQPYDREILGSGSGGGIIDEVLELLGRSGRRVQGKEGVSYVLRSLTDSARRLFALLLGEILSVEGGDERVQKDGADGGGTRGTATRHDGLGGIEFRALYRKAVQQLITASEMSFGQLLKEFYDHQMITSRRDGAGTETLSVPFRRDECEAILEDLMVDM